MWLPRGATGPLSAIKLASSPTFQMRHVHSNTLPRTAQEAQDFWRQALEAVERPVARKLASQLDLTNPLGLPPAVAARRRGTRRQKAPLYPFHLQVKNKHPTKIVLVRVRVRALLQSWVCLGTPPPSCRLSALWSVLPQCHCSWVCSAESIHPFRSR